MPNATNDTRIRESELRISFVNGATARLTLRELEMALLRRDPFYILMALAVIVSLATPPLLRGGMETWVFAVVALLQFTLFPFVLVGCFAIAVLLKQQTETITIFEPLLTLSSAIMVTLISHAFSALIAGRIFLDRSELVLSILMNFLLFESLVSVMLLFVLPHQQKFAAPQTKQEIIDKTVVLGRESIAATAIESIEADGHYLIVRTRQKTFRVNGNISKIAQNLKDWGMLVHRSHWLPYHEMANLIKTGRIVKLETKSGLLIPVSRAKLDMVSKFLDDKNAEK